MNKLILTTITAASIAAAPAYADHRYEERGRYDDGVEYAQVVSSSPVYRQVRVPASRDECRDERVVYRDQPREYSNGASTLFGAILGGVAGHQIGRGRGNAVATAAGAVIGAGIGANHGDRGDRGEPDRVAYEQHCTTVTDYRYENQVEGYDVAYRYNGRVFHTRMPYDPGSRIQVHVDVNPVSNYNSTY